MPIKKILIANRGEIALRIQSTAHLMGIETVSIYSKEDRFLSYVYNATESYQLSKEGGYAYLNSEEIIDIAKKSNSCAIHPGYGFLSENYKFAQSVIDSGLIWIGPSPENIMLAADKALSKEFVSRLNIPTIPSISIETRSINLEKIKSYSEEIGFPVILKCAHGGGGKAIRKVNNLDEVEGAIEKVASEARNNFNSYEILVEKFIEEPRHIEVQIAGDGENFIHLYERECSIQRKNQKIIEESPSLFITSEMKNKLYEASIKIASALKYKNVGTVEFLVKGDQFYFLEINTRLQVEHSVTELTTNSDLVEIQINIAKNKSLKINQDDLKQYGHSIECRIYAEDPENNFIPSTGKIKNLIIPKRPFLRIDHDLEEGMSITHHFDPMLSKVTIFGRSRDYCIKSMTEALNKTDISGVKTNLTLIKKILSSKYFEQGNINTQMISSLRTTKPKENIVLNEEESKRLLSLIKSKYQKNYLEKKVSRNSWKIGHMSKWEQN